MTTARSAQAPRRTRTRTVTDKPCRLTQCSARKVVHARAGRHEVQKYLHIQKTYTRTPTTRAPGTSPCATNVDGRHRTGRRRRRAGLGVQHRGAGESPQRRDFLPQNHIYRGIGAKHARPHRVGRPGEGRKDGAGCHQSNTSIKAGKGDEVNPEHGPGEHNGSPNNTCHIRG